MPELEKGFYPGNKPEGEVSELSESEKAKLNEFVERHKKLEAEVERMLAMPKGSAEREELNEELYNDPYTHAMYDWLNGNDIMFAPSDLKEDRTSQIRVNTRASRKTVAREAGLLNEYGGIK